MDRFEKFTHAISSVNRSVQKIKNNEMDKFGLKGLHSVIIYLLQKNKRLSFNQLRDKTSEDKATISRVLEILIQQDIVVVDDVDKKYKNTFILSAKGEILSLDILSTIENILDIIGSDLSETEREIFYKSLFIIENNLVKYLERSKIND